MPFAILVLAAIAVAFVVVAAFVVVVAMQPSTFRIERTARLSAPAPVVFAQVNDFRNWQAWSPWAKLDPAARNSFEGAPSGAGAVFAWAGNKKIGEGRMTMTESRPHELIRIDLEFLKPFRSASTAEFTFKPEGAGDQTAVTWSMSGRRPLIAKAFCLFINMDKMIGGDFEKGLAQMNAAAAEAATKS